MTLDSGRAPGARPAPSDPDADLMARIAHGDRDAARALMDRRLPRLLGLARRLLNDPAEAEDVAQETFLRVWKAADRWRSGEAKVETWMSRIAINLCYDRLRRRREVLMDAPPDRPADSPSAETLLRTGETVARVSAAVQALPDRQREALELCHYQDFTNIEAAERLGVSVEAVESLLARARRRLKDVLSPDSADLLAGFGAEPIAAGVARHDH